MLSQVLLEVGDGGSNNKQFIKIGGSLFHCKKSLFNVVKNSPAEQYDFGFSPSYLVQHVFHECDMLW